MRRRASTAGCGLVLWLVAAQAGCSGLGLRREISSRTPTPEQAARAQEISEHAQQAIDHGNDEQAKLDLRDLINQLPRSPEAQQRLGTVLQREGRLAEAKAYFQAALERDPDYVEALIGLGQVEAQRGDLLAAIKRMETAIEIDPHRSKAHYSLGRLLESMGNTDEALAEYFRALEFEPNNAAVGLQIAAIQLARKQPDQALARLDQVIELVPDDSEARALRGRTLLALRQFREAANDFRAAAAAGLPNQADVLYQLAVALEGDHKPADALHAAEAALRLAPDFADARALSNRLALVVAPPIRPRPRAANSPSAPPAEPAR
jgi:tetratricopeptide (TPR) repeat protein